jgi:hypothetical protein
MHLDLRPLTVSEYLDRTFSIYRHRFLLFVALMAPQALLSMVAAMLWGRVAWVIQFDKTIDPDRMTTLLVSGGVGLLVFSVVHWVFYVLGLGATAAAVSDLHGHLVPEAGTAFGAARRRLGPLLWLTFLMGVRLALVLSACLAIPAGLLGASAAMPTGSGSQQALAVAGLVLFLIGMTAAMAAFVYMGLRYAVAVPAVMLEPIGGRQAILRSIALTRGLKVRAFLLMICATMVAYAAMMLLQLPFLIATFVAGPETKTGFWLNMTGTATGTIGQALTAPLVAIGVVVLYFEARVRHEALDLQVMTDALGAAPPAPAAAPAIVGAPPPLPQ